MDCVASSCLPPSLGLVPSGNFSDVNGLALNWNVLSTPAVSCSALPTVAKGPRSEL